MKLVLSLALLLALFAVLGLCAWGTTTATTNLALTGGIAINQVTIMVLGAGLLFLIGLLFFVAGKMFNLGRAVERNRAHDQLDEMRHALDRARTQAPRAIAPVLLIAPPRPYDQIDPPAARRAVQRMPRVRRTALRVAKRWFQ